LATALINLAVVAETRADFEQALSGLTDLAGLVTDLGEAQSEVTGEAPPEWDPECPAYRADRLAVYLYDAVEQLDIKRRKARTQSG
jgi:hypothetical protein